MTSYLSVISLRDLLRIYGISRYKDDAISRHKMVMSLFPKELGESPRSKTRILYRVERSTRGVNVIIRSSVPPANNNALKTILEPSGYNPEELIAFRITASPISRVRSKERPLIKQEEQEEWIIKKLSEALTGITILNQADEVVQRSRTKKSVLQLVQFDGVATISDAQKLEELLESGLGRNRNYGSGLLTVKRLKQ